MTSAPLPGTFEIHASDAHSRARAGLLHTAHGDVQTPVFMPVGTLGTVKAMTDADRVAELVGSNAAEGKLGIRKATEDWDADMTARAYQILKDEGNQFADAFVSMRTGAGMTSAAAERFDTAARASVGEPVRDALVDALVEAAEAGDENAIKALPELEQFNRESGVTVVMISSELEELRQICDRIAIVSGGKIAGILPASSTSEEFGELMVSMVK